MFAYIKGTLVEITPNHAIIEAGGIGYHILIPFSTFTEAPEVGKACQLFLCPVYREDSQRLFGFTTIEERDLFLKLSDVSGVGPKTALNLIGHISIAELVMAIQHGNTKALTKVPGIGKKSAERVIIEMRDKIKGLGPIAVAPHIASKNAQYNDGVGALVNLGYSTAIAQKAIEKAQKSLGEEAKLSQLITAALQNV